MRLTRVMWVAVGQVAVGALVMAGVVACSGDDPGPSSATQSTQATPSATAGGAKPDVTVPTMPPIAEEFSANGAANFVAYYIRVIDYASKTGDVNELRRISDSGCGGCHDYIDLFENIYADGGWFKDRNWTKGPSEVRFVSDEGFESYVTTDVTLSAGHFKRSAAEDEHPSARRTRKVSFAAKFSDEWRITQFAAGDIE